MKSVQNAAFAALGIASSTLASLASFSPLSSDSPTYKVGIPSGSSISSSATGAIYFSLSAPSSYQWIGLGIGSQMSGAQIFVMYADGKGNVTISARDGGAGHVEPKLDSSLMQGVTLLAGSGDDGTTMTANVKCTTCKLDSTANSASSPWIAAWRTGSALDTTSTSTTIVQHGANDLTQFSFDLSQASLSSDSNPFVAAASGSSGGSGSTATTSGSAATTSGSSSSSGNSGSSSSSSSSSVTGAATKKAIYNKAHGIIMGVTVALLFPLGAMSMRLIGSPMLHAALQVFSLISLIAGFILGIKLAQMTDRLYQFDGKTHTVFGTVIIGLFVIQPFLGVLHHSFYKKYQARSTISHMHIWYGRIVMVLGVINGGLGLRLAANTKNGEIAYGVVAGVMALAYAMLVVCKRKKTETMRMWNQERKSEREMAIRS